MAGIISEGEFGRFCTLLDGRLDTIQKAVEEGFRRTNGRLDKHDDRIDEVEKKGCHLMPVHKDMIERIAERGSGPSAKTQVAVSAGAAGGLVGIIEIVKTAAAHFWR